MRPSVKLQAHLLFTLRVNQQQAAVAWQLSATVALLELVEALHGTFKALLEPCHDSNALQRWTAM
jgi:hypothetical protein